MEAQLAQFTNRGMNQDISISKATNEFAYKNHNIRITAVNDNTLLSITNEKLPKEVEVSIIKKGLTHNKITQQTAVLSSTQPVLVDVTVRVDYTNISTGISEYSEYVIKKGTSTVPISYKYVTIDKISIVYPKTDSKYFYYTDFELPLIPESTLHTKILGNYVGHAVLDDTLVLFTTTEGNLDRIYKLNYVNDIFEGEILYAGDLNLSIDNPLETLPLYESDEIKKVYWVDGINPPRVININKPIQYNNNTQFDFSPNIGIVPKIQVDKTFEVQGLFPSGVIQYFISYYNKFGAETGIIGATDLQYITEYNIAESPEDRATCSFKISIDNVDINYDYIRVYSCIRTSLNSEPIVSILKDIPIDGSKSFKIVDTNIGNEAIESTALLFIGGDNFIADTIAQKDNTLFLGGLSIKDNKIHPDLKADLLKNIVTKDEDLNCHDSLHFDTKYIANTDINDFQLNSSSNKISTFKRGELYRFAIQFQNKKGIWTTPEFIGDLRCDVAPSKGEFSLGVPTAVFDIPESTKDTANTAGYINYRLLMAETDNSKRSILAQGMVSPTVFNHADRVNNSGPYSLASWIIRPRNGNAQFDHLGGLGNISYKEEGTLKYLNTSTCEIQNSLEALPTGNFSNGSELINNFYVDTSIVNFYSPEIENNEAWFADASLKFRIIGVAPISSSDSDIILETNTKGINSDAGLLKNSVVINRVSRIATYADRVPTEGEVDTDTTIHDTFIHRPLYSDAVFNTDGKLPISPTSAKYFLYLWNKEGSIIGQTADSTDKDGKAFDILHADLKHKIIANRRYSFNASYFFEKNIDYKIKPLVFNSDVVESKVLNIAEGKNVIYQGNYETLLPIRSEGENDDFSYRVFFSNARINTVSSNRGGIGSSSSTSRPSNFTYTNIKQNSPVSIKYKTTTHLTFALKNVVDDSQYELLPYLSDNNEEPWSLNNLYSSEYFNIPEDIVYPWLEEGESYTQKNISDITIGRAPYVFIGEVYRELDAKEVYGGTDNNSLQSIKWIPISKPHKVNESIIETSGDTFYQRWDCLSAYPFTEEDQNSVVDITSIMLETHINLDGRYDKNKIISNIINARKTNFNKINSVYSQQDNYFTYNILDEKFNTENYQNQIAFSLTKNPMESIDTWASIGLSSSFNLDGLYGKLTKIVNLNNSLIAIQDKALSVINFNNRTALSTESGVPIEIANSGKVNGYSILASNIGCQNKRAICKASSGLYFIDHLNKSLYGFNKEGLSDITTGMSVWFKKNLTGKEILNYDALNNDIYLSNEDTCLIYNEGLQSFTSFMDYSDIHSLFNFNGYTLILNKTEDANVVIEKMFAGDYTNNYSIEYKVNPEPLIDKTFGNIEYIADCFHPLNEVDLPNSLYRPDNKPFELLEVWNEYQKGILNIVDNRFSYPNYEKKFRIWRVDIPRDSSNHRDRIRNPWVHIRLSKNSEEDNSKMVFHNLLVNYYK